jgi:hypothetical protein
MAKDVSLLLYINKIVCPPQKDGRDKQEIRHNCDSDASGNCHASKSQE